MERRAGNAAVLWEKAAGQADKNAAGKGVKKKGKK